MSTERPNSRFARLWSSPALRLLRAALVIAPLIWLVRRLDVHAIALGVERVGLSRLAIGLALQLGLSAVVSLRWRMLLGTYGSARLPSTLYLLRANLVANYFALLPVPAADEGVRVARTLSAFPRGAPSAFIVLVAERIVGLFGLLILPLSASFMAHADLTPIAWRVLTFGCAAALVLAVPALALPSLLTRWPGLRAWVERIPVLGATLARLEPPARKRDLAAALLLSVLSHAGSCAVIALLFAPLDPRATLTVCLRVQPIVLLVMSLPLTPGGVGQRELAFAALYGLAGVASTTAVSVALLSFALALAQAAIGGLVYVGERAVSRLKPACVDE